MRGPLSIAVALGLIMGVAWALDHAQDWLDPLRPLERKWRARGVQLRHRPMTFNGILLGVAGRVDDALDWLRSTFIKVFS